MSAFGGQSVQRVKRGATRRVHRVKRGEFKDFPEMFTLCRWQTGVGSQKRLSVNFLEVSFGSALLRFGALGWSWKIDGNRPPY